MPGRVPAGEHPADRVARPWRPEGPAVGPMPSLQARRSIRRRPHSSCTLSGNACGPSQGEEGGLDAGSPCPDDGTSSPPKALAVAHGETMLLRAVVDVGRLLPRLACPPPEVPTRGQRAHISAAHPWHGGPRRPASPRVSHGVPMTSHVRAGPAHAGMVLALLRERVAQALSTASLRSREHCRTLGTIEGARLATAYGPGEAKQKGPIRPALVPHRHHQASGEHRDRVLPDIGDVQDKAMALAIAFDALASSERSWGCDVLRRLRHHICTTRAVQSVQWVLPQVETAMRACAGDSSPLRCVVEPEHTAEPVSQPSRRPASWKGGRSGDLLSLTRNFSAFGVGHRWHTYAREGDEAPLFHEIGPETGRRFPALQPVYARQTARN